MALTPSTMLPLGTLAPEFHLPNTVPPGGMVSLDQFCGPPAYLVMFLCNHCPYVKHVGSQLARLGRDAQKQGVAVVAINANDAQNYPADSPQAMTREAAEAGYTFAYLFDESQAVAKAYRAACTPDFFLFDRDRKLVYRGQLDGSRPGNGVPVTGADLRKALAEVLAGKPVSVPQLPSMGCNIKWKEGAAPEYF